MADEKRREELERRLRQVIRREPGIQVQAALQRVLDHVRVRRQVVLEALWRLSEEGSIARRRLGHCHHLFDSESEFLSRWRQVVALRDSRLQPLIVLLEEQDALTLAQVQILAKQRLGWSPTTTARRIRCLQQAGLLGTSRPGQRFSPLQIQPPSPILQEIIRHEEHSGQWLRVDVGTQNGSSDKPSSIEGDCLGQQAPCDGPALATTKEEKP